MITLIAELATNHGGDLDIAKRLIDDAAGAGANLVKTQAYDLAKLNPSDPQADWLRQAHLTEADHVALKAHADSLGVRYFASAFDQKSADFVVKLCGIVKFASSVDVLTVSSFGTIYKTHPWRVPTSAHGWVPMEDCTTPLGIVDLVTVPFYPTPPECLAGVTWAEDVGWSDHVVGLAGCLHAYQQGVRLFEVHMTTPYAARQCAWDKSPEQIRQLRVLCEDLETIRTGVNQQFRERWSA